MTELQELHLAELRERAAAAGIPRFRLLRREQLIERLQGGGESGGGDDGDGGSEPAREQGSESADEQGSELAREEEPTPSPRRAGAVGRGRGGRATERPAEQDAEPAESERDTDEMAVVEAKVLDDADPKPAEDAARPRRSRGILDLTRQRYGFLRLDRPRGRRRATSTSPPPRCAAASCARATRSPARRASRAAASATARSSTSITVNGEEPQAEHGRTSTRSLRWSPSAGSRSTADADVLVRAVDLLAPLAYGQRVLVRAAARSGRTTLLRSIARAVAAAETARVIVLLIDESPEEATAWREALPVAEFAIATADMAPAEQVRAAELALERARRLAESGTDAVLICDSLSRLAFAAGDVAEVKRLFGSGRNLAGGGSLTVVATVVADAQDEGEAERAVATTESSLIVLDPELAAAGVTPALAPASAGSRTRTSFARATSSRRPGGCARCSRTWGPARPPTCCASGSRAPPRTPSCSDSVLELARGTRATTRRARARARSAPSRGRAGRSRRCGCRRRRRRRARPP